MSSNVSAKEVKNLPFSTSRLNHKKLFNLSLSRRHIFYLFRKEKHKCFLSIHFTLLIKEKKCDWTFLLDFVISSILKFSNKTGMCFSSVHHDYMKTSEFDWRTVKKLFHKVLLNAGVVLRKNTMKMIDIFFRFASIPLNNFCFVNILNEKMGCYVYFISVKLIHF